MCLSCIKLEREKITLLNSSIKGDLVLENQLNDFIANKVDWVCAEIGPPGLQSPKNQDPDEGKVKARKDWRESLRILCFPAFIDYLQQ